MLTETGDEALALLAAGGDRQAFGLLLDRHYDRVFRISLRLLGDRTEAEDLAQEVCVSLAPKIRSFRGEAKFTTWLYKVVMNAGRDAMRRQGARNRATAAFAEVDDMRRADDAARAAEAEWLREALATLKPDLRETAVLVLDEGLNHAEAGDVLGCKESTISWRLMEIRKALKALAASNAELEP